MKKIGLLHAIFAVLVLSCAGNKNPFSNPSDAVIVPDKSFQSLDSKHDSLKANTAATCSVGVYLANLIDSFYVQFGQSGSTDSVIASGAVSGSAFAFVLSEKTPGSYRLAVYIVKSDKSLDSLVKTVTIYTLAPVVAADSAAHHIFLPADSFTVNFTVTDPDSNVWKAYTWLDTAVGAAQQTAFPPKTYRSVISQTVTKLDLIAALKTPLVCYAIAIDFPDSNVSRMAACTLYVKDTIRPQIRLIPPTDTVNPVSSPVTVKALVTDAAGVDSVLFNNLPMVANGDTAVFVASFTDSGSHTDSIVALDKAGNRGRLAFTLHIQGKQSIPPRIKDLSRATPQGRVRPHSARHMRCNSRHVNQGHRHIQEGFAHLGHYRQRRWLSGGPGKSPVFHSVPGRQHVARHAQIDL